MVRPEAKETVKNATFNTIYEHQMTAWFALKKMTYKRGRGVARGYYGSPTYEGHACVVVL